MQKEVRYMEVEEQIKKAFLDGDITFNELRERKGLKPVNGGGILITGEKRRVFYLCNGEVPFCKKSICYKNENATDVVCRHTTNIAYALNFQKGDGCVDYFEKPSIKQLGTQEAKGDLETLENHIPLGV